ncbi:MAG: hypothetical protein J1E62_04460 [Lachnospiraceae bacterium]|nr:hypothetical protein [Lachnospiraceae bacterium]
MRKSVKKLFTAVSAGVMALALTVTAVPATVGATNVSKAGKKAAKQEFDASGNTVYHAYFGLQQKESWIFRDEWYAEENGLNGNGLPEGQKFEGTVFQSGDNGVEPIAGAVVTDVEIKGNGVYTVGVQGLGGVLTEAESSKQAVMSMLYVDTDIPVKAKDKITITDWKLVIDGNSQTLPADVFYCEESEDESGLLRFDPFNDYQKEKGTYPDCPSIRTPNDSVEITFTVGGFDIDNPDAVEATPEPAADDSSSSSSSSDSGSESSGGLSGGAVAAIVVVVVVVIAAIAIALKRKND